MNDKITSAAIKNYGMLNSFSCNDFSNINLIIGENGTGKTFLLKSLYSAVRTIEDYKRGDDIRPVGEVLSEKLRWTFQVDKLGDLVDKSSNEPLSFSMKLDGDKIGYQFSSSAVSKIVDVTAPEDRRSSNSIFLPAKEVLSLYSVILKSREVDRSFGFDDTYYDLVKALRISPRRGKNYTVFADARKMLVDVIGGKVQFEEDTGKWSFKNNRQQKFSIGATAEGIKKISIIDRLLANGYLDNHSIIFIDEIESALHPEAVCQLLDMVDSLADKMGIQFFISSHSYFVIKKMALMAKNKKDYIKCISLDEGMAPHICDLSEGMPENSIIDTSIALYEQYIEQEL